MSNMFDEAKSFINYKMLLKVKLIKVEYTHSGYCSLADDKDEKKRRCTSKEIHILSNFPSQIVYNDILMDKNCFLSGSEGIKQKNQILWDFVKNYANSLNRPNESGYCGCDLGTFFFVEKVKVLKTKDCSRRIYCP
jgi:hypothetical protein